MAHSSINVDPELLYSNYLTLFSLGYSSQVFIILMIFIQRLLPAWKNGLFGRKLQSWIVARLYISRNVERFYALRCLDHLLFYNAIRALDIFAYFLGWRQQASPYVKNNLQVCWKYWCYDWSNLLERVQLDFTLIGMGQKMLQKRVQFDNWDNI